jgi:hypothetical protein
MVIVELKTEEETGGLENYMMGIFILLVLVIVVSVDKSKEAETSGTCNARVR